MNKIMEDDEQDFLSRSQVKRAYSYDYPMAGMTADIVIFRERWETVNANSPSNWQNVKRHDVLLIQRKNNPYKFEYCCPGGYVNVLDELVIDGALRELYEEAGLIIDKSWLQFVGYYDSINRDPRGRTLSFAFTTVLSGPKVTAGDDAMDYKWVPILGTARTILGFDHKQIVVDACKKLNLEFSNDF